MAVIFVQNDIGAVLAAELRAHSELLLIEDSTQITDISLPTGWDFLAHENARQFQFQIGDEWALVVLRTEGETLLIDIPAHKAISDTIADATAKLVAAALEVTQSTALRRDKDRSGQEFIETVESYLDPKLISRAGRP